jgi:hypothetical protein
MEYHGERDFFKLTLLSAVLNISPYVLNHMADSLDPSEMYLRARREKVLFNQFQEWINH